ncbi:response regulator transcription factor [Kocuria rosea]|uniref:response regulator transcription factor n=1 Tax=Kocuria rosea TaxID=1275 RepID=UPI002331092C|nr:response regulator transcription factor [Kocuria rosea]
MHVAVVEDDEGVADALVDALEAHWMTVTHLGRGQDVLIRHLEFDIVLLDLGLPDLDGIEVLRRLRQVSRIPIIILTARDDERSVVRGLHNGADDYLVKPARMSELLARIETVRRRTALVSSTARTGLRTFGDVVIDVEGRSLTIAGNRVQLTTKEFDLLAVLVENPGAAVSRQQLMDRLWGDAFVAVSRSLDVHMTALRSKIGRPGSIETIRGFGYRWVG